MFLKSLYENRNNFLSTLKILTTQLDNPAVPKLNKHEQQLTVEEKRRIVEYELDLEEKKQTSSVSISSNGL